MGVFALKTTKAFERGLEGLDGGSPGRTRTCDQPVTSAPVFQPGLDYLFTRLQYMQGRVSGADEALLDGFRSL